MMEKKIKLYDKEFSTLFDEDLKMEWRKLRIKLLELDKKGICVSSGSACSSGNTDISHVITAIKVPPEYAKGALRVTMGDYNTKAQVDYLVENLVESVNRLREW